MQVQIRNMEAQDIDRCAQISSETLMFQQYGLTLERARDLLSERYHHADRVALVAENKELSDDKSEKCIFGFVEIVPSGTFGIGPYIQQLVVAKEARGLGVGEKLMLAAQDLYKLNKYGMSLLVNSENKGAIRFYERLGYKLVGQIEGLIKPEFTELIFFKKQISEN